MRLRSALEANNIDGIIQAYGEARKAVRFGAEDATAMAQALNTAVHELPVGKDRRVPQELLRFADLLVQDIRNNHLPPSRPGHFHLLTFFREAEQYDKGSSFWSWLVEQDDTYVNPQSYRVAIEILSIQGKPAGEVEDLYALALKRYPGNFNEYHLSPQSVVSDRSQPINVSGIPTTLLIGIVSARLLRGDTKNAYIGLDTALRLFPAQVPARMFAILIEERPASEAYKVFLLACRSGVVVGQDTVKTLLTKLRTLATSSPIANEFAIRAVITSVYLYIVTGGKMASSHLTEIVLSTAGIVQDRKLNAMTSTQLNEITDRLFVLVKELFEVCSQQGVRPSIVTFNSIITNLVGKGGRRDRLADLLVDIQTLQLRPSAVTYRSILTAAGNLHDSELLQSSWSDLAEIRESSGTPLNYSDWLIFARAAVECGDVDFVRQQLQRLAHTVTRSISERIENILQGGPHDQAKSDDSVELSTVFELIDRIGSDVHRLGQAFQGDALWVSHEGFLSMSLGENTQVEDRFVGDHGIERKLRALYDELTTDPQAQGAIGSAAPALPAAVSSTGIPFDELRYQNWKTINELLAEAEERDSAYEKAVDVAISQGTAPPKRSTEWMPSPRRTWRSVSQDCVEVRRLRG